MPIPKPVPEESEDKFMQRCMIDNVMVDEYPSIYQRRAICAKQWTKQGE